MASQGSRQKVVGDYKLERRLGSGSFASVFLAQHVRFSEKQVAIKAISRSKLNKKLEANLQKEIFILQDMQHENIVQLYETHQTKKHIYLVMEYCAGGDLHMLLRKQGVLGIATVRSFMTQLATGMKYLWCRNLIHRDLKPQNLLLTDRTTQATLKIADFGFATQLGAAAMAETMCGSPLYMAPEVLDGQCYDAKADLWSAGTILFEMIAGKPPYSGNSPRELLQNIQKRRFKFPHDTIKAPQDCVDLLEKLLRANPVERIPFQDFYDHTFFSGSPSDRHVGGTGKNTQDNLSSSHSSNDSSLPASDSSGDSIFGASSGFFLTENDDDDGKSSPKKEKDDAWEMIPSATDADFGSEKKIISKEYSTIAQLVRFSGELWKRAEFVGHFARSMSNDECGPFMEQAHDMNFNGAHLLVAQKLLNKMLEILTQALNAIQHVKNMEDDSLNAAAKLTRDSIRRTKKRMSSLELEIRSRLVDIERQTIPGVLEIMLRVALFYGHQAAVKELVAHESRSASDIAQAESQLSIGQHFIELVCANPGLSKTEKEKTRGLNALFIQRMDTLKQLKTSQ